ncbi:programmed cell death 6-interacting protein-like isoform X2 [Saccostrea echinata]|uniref:programmed cell death 6-interacting protein-like isoform X2 n=1 Tax=Saccostrea echinata TaxID=191078 RepID=UPI002A82DDBC|nr:programmed cell death 6-interacting protein-like isoform X2 [Saccostrea echinata]
MATFLAVPLKQTQEVELTKPLRSFIQNTFTQVEPDDYNHAINEFSKLRNLMIAKSVDKHESALEVLYRYYDQLCAIENKLPIAENQIRVNFKWRNAFDKESLFGGKQILGIASGAYEKVCMLFNIAALQSQIAEVQNHDSDEGLKTSAKYFQMASGIFGHLKDIVLSHVQQEPTPDLSPDTLNALSALIVAQAQEAIYRKAAADRMKEAMVAKIAYQCSDLYSDAMKLMQLASLKELWPKDWVPLVACKQAGFHGMAEFYQSCVAQQSKSYGEQIARLQKANELLTAAQSRGGAAFAFKTEQGRVQRELQAAKKDNDFIYHDKIPDLKNLPTIGKAAIAKPAPFPNKPMSEGFTDLFEKLVPIPVYEALTAFENRKTQIMNTEIGRLREQTQLMNSILASLNLPAALEDLSGKKVPQSVIEKAQQIKDIGGIQYLDKLMNELPELLQRNREILNESIRMLEEEEASDKQLREQFKERWTRTPSDKLTQPMRDESMKYKQILDTAINADRIVKEKYQKHKQAIELLSKSPAEIDKALPSGGGAHASESTGVVQKLRKLMDDVETIKAEREAIENELKEAKFDMTSKFFSALASEGAINEEMLSMSELDRIYGPLREQVNESLRKQDSVMAQVQPANMEFCQAKASDQSGAQREAMLKDLAAGFDMFMELKSNLEEGTKFYNDLTPLLVRLQNKISDFCFARKTEKDELMSDLQKSIASQPTGPTPPPPSYQSPSATTQSRAPPARPPPPQFSSASPGPSPSSSSTQSGQPNTQSGPPSYSSAPSGPPVGGYSYPGGPPPQYMSANHPSAPPPAQPSSQNYAGPGQQSWGNAPYPQAGGGYQGMPMPAMPSGFNPYNPYTYSQPSGYPTQGYPQQGYPQQYPGQGYPQQQYPQQGYPGGNQPYPQQNQWR